MTKDYPPYLDYPKPRKKLTRADKIRQMTDEELAKALYYYGNEPFCRNEPDCDRHAEKTRPMVYFFRRRIRKHWLRSVLQGKEQAGNESDSL